MSPFFPSRQQTDPADDFASFVDFISASEEETFDSKAEIYIDWLNEKSLLFLKANCTYLLRDQNKVTNQICKPTLRFSSRVAHLFDVQRIIILQTDIDDNQKEFRCRWLGHRDNGECVVGRTGSGYCAPAESEGCVCVSLCLEAEGGGSSGTIARMQLRHK
jgi:hypothetical protein